MVKVKETGILFKPEMIRAYLAGLKTQTRRLVKGVSDGWVHDGFNIMGEALFYPPDISDESMAALEKRDPRFKCPYGKAGDHLWTRETIGYPLDGGSVIYRADGGFAELPDFAKKVLEDGKWTPAIHQKRFHSRATIKLLGVRVESLQDISEADAIEEGFKNVAEFAAYIDTINGKGTWASSPWVWVLELERYKNEAETDFRKSDR